MSKRNIIIGVGVVVLAIGWYAFRIFALSFRHTSRNPGSFLPFALLSRPLSLPELSIVFGCSSIKASKAAKSRFPEP